MVLSPRIGYIFVESEVYSSIHANVKNVKEA